MKKSDLINNDTNLVIETLESTKRLAVGLIVLMFFALTILCIYASVSYTEKKAMQSKIDSLRSSKQSLENNLLMPVEIRKFNELNK